MHEQSLIKSLLQQVEAIRQQHGANFVKTVRVEVGPLSGVEPLLLASCFKQFSPRDGNFPTELVVSEVPLLARCNECSVEFEVQNYTFRCPTCGAGVQVTSGEGIYLIDVELSDTD